MTDPRTGVDELRERLKPLRLDAGPLGSAVCMLFNAIEGDWENVELRQAEARALCEHLVVDSHSPQDSDVDDLSPDGLCHAIIPDYFGEMGECMLIDGHKGACREFVDPDEVPSVKMPESEDEAAPMTLIGEAWLREHAPHRLRHAVATPDSEPSADVAEGVANFEECVTHYLGEPSGDVPASERERQLIWLLAAMVSQYHDDDALRLVAAYVTARGVPDGMPADATVNALVKGVLIVADDEWPARFPAAPVPATGLEMSDEHAE